MARVNKLRSNANARRHRVAPRQLMSRSSKIAKAVHMKKTLPKALVEKKDWEGATCSVCLEHPHNAVLLLCSSYDNGCRPYMCATSHRFSNCLEQYKKASTKAASKDDMLEVNASFENLSSGLGWGAFHACEKREVPELLCPLCRSQVKGWTVVEPAREHLNSKKRACMQNKCSFVGNYKQLRKHVKVQHPSARPRAIDPVLEEKWKKLEHERERDDVISTIMSSTPGALVLGDYVIEPGHRAIYNDHYDSDESLDDGFFSLGPFEIGYDSYDSLDEDDHRNRRPAGSGSATASRRGFRRIVFARSGHLGHRGSRRTRNY